MTILVIGGAGYIGSNLWSKLSQDSKNIVISLDNYFTGTTLNHVEKVKYIKGNSKDIFNLIEVRPDIIFHLGEYSRVEQSFEDRKKVWEFNINSITEVIEFALKNNSKLIYSGSSTKYGDNGKNINESPYAFTKAKNTELIKNCGTWFGLKYAIVYFYNVYGKNEITEGKYATLIGIYKQKIANNEPLPVVKPGTQKRNFTHIDDIINGLIIVGEKGTGDLFGIGNDKSYSIIEVAEMFKGNIEYLPERKGNRMDARVESEKTKKLGWNCKHSLPDDIRKYI